MEPVREGEKPCASLLLGADVSRGFVVRSGKQGAAKRGGMGAMRIRETYLRGDRLLVRIKDTLLGEGGGEEGEGCSFQATGGGEDGRKHSKRRCSYVCPTADFLHCYLELFDRPNFAACFQRDGGSGGDAAAAAGTTNAAHPPAADAIGGGVSGQERPPPCCLLLLHSELSKLTGATGALSMKQERRLSQLARSLPGTMVFFDKFCPDLHGASAASTAGTTDPGERGPPEVGEGGDTSGLSPPDALRPPTPAVHASSTSSVLAACRWCSEKLGGASVVVLSDDGHDHDRDGTGAGGFLDDDAPPPPPPQQQQQQQQALAVGDHARMGGTGAAGGGGAELPRVLGLREFLRGYVGGDTEEELARRGDLLRRAHLSCKAATTSSSKAGGGPATGTATTSSPLQKPHPSKTQLEALIASGAASKGRLDVFEHNPKEGVVVVGAGGGAALDGWTDASGRAKVLVAGREGMNRSMHGDTVAVMLLPRRRWRAPTDRKRLTHAAEEEEDIPLEEFQDAEGAGGGGEAPPGAMPTGFVVGVLEEGRRPYVVTIPSEETTGQGGTATVAAVPMDPRVPKIRIKTRQLAQISGQRLVAMVDGWDVGHVFPFGHYVTSLGPVGEVSSEAAALLVECEASFQPFSFNALASLPLVPNPPKESQKPRDALLPPATLAERERPEDGFGKAPRWQDSGWRVQESDVAGRRDLRKERAMSVDPPGCQDIDDAMHVKRKPNGKLEIGVHIADVTRFVEADSPLDREARARATTVYLVHRRIDMLPTLLSSDLCSLHAGEDRLSVSVMWEAEEAGHEDIRLCKRADGSHVCWFGRTVIHSKASMAYDQAQMLVEDGRIEKKRGHEEPPPGQAGRDVREGLQPGLAHDLRLLTRFARTARAERVRNGAIDLSQAGAELKFKIDPVTGTPLAVAGKEDSEIHHTIAELMILANGAVAEKIQGAFPSQALVRVHASPDPSRLTAFEGVAAKVGVNNTGESSGKPNGSAGGLSQSLATVEGGALRGQGEGGKSKAGLLKSLAVRAMSEAEYVSTGTLSDHQAHGKGLEAQEESRFGHFGLGLSHYTHFTSPIRRYADIVVHRLLLASLGVYVKQASNATHHTTKAPPRLLSGDRFNAPPAAKREDVDEGVVALPSSLAPSVMEMEEAAVGKLETDAAAEGQSRRAGAGDASFVINPDGTRTYSKVSMSTTPTAPTPTMTASRLRPPPGMESFPELDGPDDGDDLLDSLLGLEVSGSTTAIAAPATAGGDSGFGSSGDVSGGTMKTKSFSAAAAASGNAAAAAPAADSATFDGDGDSMLDALLGLEIGPTTARDGGEATPGEENQDDITAHGGGGGDTGEAFSPSARDDVVADSPPFGGAELGRLCTHLNDRNRRAKRLAQRCQEMFLCLFFKDHSQVVQGLVLSLRSNGFIAYVPAFDAKGPVYISDREGQVQVDPALLGLPAGAGNPPSKAFATLPACRALPGAGVSLVSTPPAGKSNAVSAYYKAGRGGGPGRDGEGEEDEEVLEVRPPPGGGGKVLRLRVLDCVSLRLSCEVLPTQARLPKVRFLLAGVGSHPASHRPAAAPAGTTATTTPARATRSDHQVHPSRPAPGGGVGSEIDPSGMRVGGGRGSGGEAALLHSKGGGGSSDGRRREGGGGGGGEGGLYWLLQGARDDAVARGNFDEPGGGPAGQASTTSTRGTEPSPPASATAAAAAAAEKSAAEIAVRRKKKERNKRKSNSGGPAASACASREQQRSEVGAGRALFGGFVPRRHAPAASLHDFGGKGQGAGSEQGGGETGGDGGFAGVLSLPSIYNQGGGRGLVPAGGGGVLETLDDARVRQYTQEATARAQRLGAEKRSSRITKSKRQG